MKRFSYEEKCSAVRAVIEDHFSYLKAGRMIGASKTTVLKWVGIVKNHGYEGLKANSGKHHDGQFKVDVIEYMHKNHVSSYTAAAHFNVSRTQIQRWERIYYERGALALMEKMNKSQSPGRKPRKLPDDNQDLLKELEYLRMENEYLKKLSALVQKREQEKQKKSRSSEN